MKYFNVLVVAAWLAMFAISLRPIDGPDPEQWGMIDKTVVAFNEAVITTCFSCAYPNEPFADFNPQTNTYEIVQPHQLAIVDNRMTQVILVNTFRFVVFTMMVINLAFYFGLYFPTTRPTTIFILPLPTRN